MIDSHVHSNFSGDSEMPVEDACTKAMEAGLDGLAFTDHLDIDYPHQSPDFDIDFEVYSHCMDSVKERYRKKLKVLKGIEVGIQPHTIEPSLEIVRKYDFDFVISSVHVIDGQDPYYGDYFNGKTRQQAFMRYLQAVLHCVSSFKDYDVAGHIGYVRRYGGYDDKTLRYSDYHEILDEILKTIISSGKGIEINSSGYRVGLGSPVPDYDIVERYIKLGGEIISVGSDAHCREHIGHSFPAVKAALQSLGVKYTAHFEKRRAVFDRI
ncbi:histidinol-phosphatase (PHP family) [Anaerobacterium chartisolvens]|uniref:Histidinol-phosphatase n=1 Tax=Anaerobacterium chartisolvens TaxID=1297424 RepID=A0A369B8H0_9FIRM|nr:histidinol-phosphatase HisJ family protein [Anaerobacterium chartisolvens]RCX16846.1 histidinol-phosphatase (PHP family) [Anaerobacterium chartisolvens]